jgi:hypothetical protein
MMDVLSFIASMKASTTSDGMNMFWHWTFSNEGHCAHPRAIDTKASVLKKLESILSTRSPGLEFSASANSSAS